MKQNENDRGGYVGTSSEAIKQRILGDTSQVQKRARQRAEAARKRSADVDARHENILSAPVGNSGGGHFAEAAAIAHTLQPPSPSHNRARAKQLEPGSEQSYHMEASSSYMEGLIDQAIPPGTTVAGIIPCAALHCTDLEKNAIVCHARAGAKTQRRGLMLQTYIMAQCFRCSAHEIQR